MKLTSEEIDLILSALRCDRVGTYGDDREEKIQKLIKKIKKERASK